MKRKRPLTYNKRREHGQQLTNINTYRHYIFIYSMTGQLRGGGGGQPGRRPGADEFRGPTSQTRKNARVYLEQGKQNKMCAFVNM
jgi:hypothetical protein